MKTTSQLSVWRTVSGKNPTDFKYLINSTTLLLYFKITANSTNQMTKKTPQQLQQKNKLEKII